MAAQEYYNPNNNFEHENPHAPPSYPSIPPPQYQPPLQYQQNAQAPLRNKNQQLPQYPPDFDNKYSHEAHEPAPRPSSSHYSEQIPPQQYQQNPYPPPQPPRHYPPHYPAQYLPNTEPLSPQRSYSEPPSLHEHRHHRHRHHSRHSRTSSRSSSPSREVRKKPKENHKASNTFLGALGGGVIGDLIFPGLGTLGGALIGGLGGHEAGRSRSHDGNGHRRIRDRYQEEYDEGRRRRGEI